VIVREGDRLPDATLADARGGEVRLGSLRGEAVLLVFLRHLD
jgi:peroxiredoxin